MVIPELIRLLTERGIELDETISIVRSMTAYTNHTITCWSPWKMASWILARSGSSLGSNHRKLDRRVKAEYKDPAVQIIDENDRVTWLTWISIMDKRKQGCSTHTEILKNSELKLSDIYPEKFNNKTNGITFRRWLMHANPSLSHYLDDILGRTGTMTHLSLKDLLSYEDKMPSKKIGKHQGSQQT